MRKNILFCGTPQFSIASLRAVNKHQDELNYNLVGVITIPDKISGRGHKKQESAVKKEAKLIGIKIFEPTDLSESNFINQIKKLNLDLIIVVAFKKLPKILFNIPKIGTINLHASLLPKYRGAAPINWAIINGEKKTGLTTFFINDHIDTGDIILRSEIPINTTWHANDLHDELIKESCQIIYKTLKLLIQDTYKTIKQKNQLGDQSLKYAPKIKKSDRIVIDDSFFENKTVKNIYDFIRGMSPPGVKITIIIHKEEVDLHNTNQDLTIKNIIITKVGNYNKDRAHPDPNKLGNIYISPKDTKEIMITNGSESFNIESLKLENGKEITAKEFYNGFLKKTNYLNTISFKKKL